MLLGAYVADYGIIAGAFPVCFKLPESKVYQGIKPVQDSKDTD